MKPLFDIFWSRTGLLAVLGLGLLFVPFHWAHFIAFLFLFTAFDVWGFRDVDQRRGTLEYRIIQLMFQALFTFAIVLIDGWPTAIACTIGWLFLTCDVLYYYAVSVPLEPFTWFKLSPVNFYYNVVSKQSTPVWAVLTSAILGLAAGLFLTIAER